MAPRVRSQRTQAAAPAPETSVARNTRSRSASVAKVKSAADIASSAVPKMTRARSASVAKSKGPKSPSVPSFQQPTVASTSKARANSSTPGPDAEVKKASKPVTKKASKPVAKKAVKPVTKKASRPSSPTPTVTAAEAGVPVPTVTTAQPVTKKAAAPKTVPSEPERDAYGSARASTESRLMAEHAALLLERNIIDADTAAKLSTPWHKTGVLSLQWEEKYLQDRSPTLQGGGEIMDLEKARRIAARKDAAERKWLADFEAGRIDEDGKRISPPQSNSDVDVSSGSDIEVLLASPPKKVAAPKKAATPKKEAPKKEAIKKVASGRVSKPSQAANKMALPPIPEAEEPQDPSSTVPPPPPPAVKPAPGAKSRPRKGKPANFIVPDPGAENYEQFSYMELLAIGRERGLKTGGDEWKVRERLISDDNAVRDGTERDLATYGRSGARKFQTKAPVVAKAPSGKRKRGVVDEGGGEASAAKKKKGE
ncbi:hypothetical protein K505DRAFT_373520 [Melanomma pulvis-pyrius CBS 109.77]|uniref:Uncharacterized protein n=1 Tax=Melanomma pulvis-pyrius CBS 109.77 TaxID=1314802 RepID=A0A6A6XKA1_9PLEO|nr:hypothetical protein K505DRAFT_373520 [Melanomma pulvis-pyrius CBS 109.77]